MNTSRIIRFYQLIHVSLITFLLVVVCHGPSGGRVAAQDLDNVTITGRVTDQNGAVIAGATVTAILVKTGLARSTLTDSEGRYRILKLEPGLFLLRTFADGFATDEKQDITTIAGQTMRLETTLYPSGVTAEQVVIGTKDIPPIDTTRTVVGGTVTTHEIDSLPIQSRSPLDLIFTLAGVTEEPLSTRDLAEDREADHADAPEEAGVFTLAGGPAYSNNITIDGLDNNDDRAARERFQPSLAAVEEVQVITNQFSAEYGRASGGRVNLRTRGGSKSFRGQAFYFFRDEALNANTFRNNTLGMKRLPLQEHNPGFTLGGRFVPRSQSATFFFTSYELNKVLDSTLIDTLVPVEQSHVLALPSPTDLSARRIEDASAPALNADIAPFVSSISTPITNHIFSTRIDHQFSQTHTGVFTVQLGRQKNSRQSGGGNRLPQSFQSKIRKSAAFSYADTFVVSANTVIQTRAQFSHLAPAVKAPESASPVVLITLNDPLLAGDPNRRTGTLVAASSTSGATDRRENRWQVQNVIFHNRGPSSLKFGFDTQRISSTFIDLSDATGTFTFASAGDFLSGIPNRFRQNFLTESTQRNTYGGFFLQDEFRPRENLLISLGLRYENESIIRDRNNFGPRLSVAYDPFGSGKTVVRFGAAIFYNRALLRTIDDFTLGARQLFFDTNSIQDPATGRVLSADERRTFIAANLSFPNVLSVDSPLVKQFGVLNSDFSRRLDPNLRIPESYQANIGIERDVGNDLVIEANYTFNRGLHLWREFNANAPTLPAGFQNFTEYLASRDFENFRSSPTGTRPLHNAVSAGELVRFILEPRDPTSPNSIVRLMEFGVPISLVNLNSFTSTTSVDIALAALNNLRPDPTRTEVEQLISAGNSFYHGLTLELRKRMLPGSRASFRAAYTLSSLIDDGVVNTSDALIPGEFPRERARSLLDRRHRFVLSGSLELPLARLRLFPILRLASGAPFNISLGGVDRNLDDVGNDRPNFHGDLRLLRWRGPGDGIAAGLVDLFSLPTIGQSGNLPRNAGRGPGLFLFDLSIARDFQINGKRLRPLIEFHNVLNKTVFSFGAEFINFSALAPTATPEQRQAFLDSFLVATRTLRPRQIRLGMRFDF
ncbi:MAG TPA: carboxypeptidase regulatory-like domain-containing protein [Pyrinomonadaceae bacterium]|nr:carboxypeptidase regulatory-like domain-containing protein [Pyrinomonadaceae bacterium]